MKPFGRKQSSQSRQRAREPGVFIFVWLAATATEDVIANMRHRTLPSPRRDCLTGVVPLYARQLSPEHPAKGARQGVGSAAPSSRNQTRRAPWTPQDVARRRLPQSLECCSPRRISDFLLIAPAVGVTSHCLGGPAIPCLSMIPSSGTTATKFNIPS